MTTRPNRSLQRTVCKRRFAPKDCRNERIKDRVDGALEGGALCAQSLWEQALR